MTEAKKVTKKSAKAATEPKEKQIKHAEVVAETVPVEAAPEAKLEVEPVVAKAGKRSTKAAKEAEAKQAKQAAKVTASTDKPVSKPLVKAARSKVERAGKKYREAAKLIDNSKNYSLGKAVELAGKTSPTKFDSTIEMHINLGVDPKQADQNVRDTVVLPAGSGKTIKIAVLAEADDAAKAKAAGADISDADTLFAALDKETLDFDVLIAVPTMMARLGKYARLLGPRGLMPNPKSGTVTANVAEAVAEAKAGRVEYRVDQAGIIHLGIGKASFSPEKLRQNADAVLASVRAAKPASVKGIYIKTAYISSSMGPSIKLDISAN
jgi:large subunit ribosomal protein L1